MDLRAVQALVVVLDDDLPVGLDLVHQTDADPELVHLEALEGRDRLRAVGERLHQRPRLAGEVHEEEPGVAVDRYTVERVGRPLEELVLLHVRRADQLTVQVVGPRVIRTDERLADVAGPLEIVDELRSAVAADVVEAAQLAGLGPHHEDRLACDVANDVVAGVRDLLGPAGTDPVAPPDPLSLTLVHLPAGVVAAFERGARVPGAAVFAEAIQRASVGLHIACSSGCVAPRIRRTGAGAVAASIGLRRDDRDPAGRRGSVCRRWRR